MSIDDTLEDDFLRHVSSHATLVATAIVLVALRIYVKTRIVRNIGPEDFALIFALLCSLVFTASYIRENYYARQGLSISGIEERLKCVYIGGITYGLSLAFTKFSFLLQYLRIFHYKSMRIAIWIVLAIVIIYCTWGFFRSILPCSPPSDFWEISIASEPCVDAIKYYTAHAALNVVTDVFTLLLPIPGLKKLMLPRAQKLGLILVFMLGGFTCIASSLRLGMLIHATDGVLFTRWAGNSIGMWTAIEMDVAIICCCLPPLRPLAARLWRKLRQSKRVERSCRFVSSGISGLSSFIGTGRLSSTFLSSKSKTTTSTPSRSDNKSPGEYSHGTKSKGSDGTIFSNTNTNDTSIISEPVYRRASDYDDCSRAFDDVAINSNVACCLARSNAATPNALGHGNEESQDPYQHCRNRQKEQTLHQREHSRSECRRSSISWLSITETVYDESHVDENTYDYTGGDAYDSGFPDTAV